MFLTQTQVLRPNFDTWLLENQGNRVDALLAEPGNIVVQTLVRIPNKIVLINLLVHYVYIIN